MSSTTVAKMVYRVRHMTGQLGVTEGIPLPSILDALGRAAITVHSKLSGRAGLNTTFITTAANDYDYTLSESEPHSLQEFRLRSSGLQVVRRSLAEWLSYRTANPDSTGDPIVIAFSEAASGTVTAYLWPTPASADVIEAVRAVNITDAFQGISGSDLTATTFDFGIYGTLAVCHLAAAELLPDGPDRRRHEAQSANLTHEESVRLAAHYAGDGSLPWAI